MNFKRSFMMKKCKSFQLLLYIRVLKYFSDFMAVKAEEFVKKLTEELTEKLIKKLINNLNDEFFF